MAEKAKAAGKKGKPANRAASGKGGATRFKPGQSGNPDGRPKLPPELKARARELSPHALEVLAQIMDDEDAAETARIKAAELIINRAYGTPPASVEITNLSDLPRITIEAAP